MLCFIGGREKKKRDCPKAVSLYWGKFQESPFGRKTS